MRTTRRRSRAVLLALVASIGCAPSEPKEEAARPDARAIWDEGLRLEQQGDFAAALEQFERAIATGPYVEAWQYYFGLRLIRARPLDEVEAYFRARLEQDPKPQTTHYLWAAALLRHRRFDDAVDRIDRALAADPAHEMSYELLGDVRAAQGRTDDALAAYARALAIHPELVSSHLRRAELLESLGRADEARRHREAARTSDPNTPRRFFYWGRALLREGRVEAAIAELEQAVRIDPADEEARALLAQARARSNATDP